MPHTQDLNNTLTLILAGGQGERLMPLTRDRAKPAVPFGGMYRIIDFTLTNCIHSGLRSIYVLTQYQARSLEEHIRFGWNFLPRRLGQFISVRPPHHLQSGKWYQGTADAIYHNIDTLEKERPERVLILSGDHIYKMDYGRMLIEHEENGAALTIGAIPVRTSEASRFGVFEVDQDQRVVGFQEKPDEPKSMPDRPGWSLASMGIYMFETSKLIEVLRADAEREGSSHDFGKDIIPRMIEDSKVFAHNYVDVSNAAEPYWRDIGTLDSYYEANIDLCRVEPKFNLYDSNWPIYTFTRYEPPAKTVFGDPAGKGLRAEVLDSLLCHGAVISGAKIKRSIISGQVRVEKRATVDSSILFTGVTVGADCRIRRAIIDKWVQIPDGTEIGYDLELDAKRFKITPSGIVVVPHGYDFGRESAVASPLIEKAKS